MGYMKSPEAKAEAPPAGAAPTALNDLTEAVHRACAALSSLGDRATLGDAFRYVALPKNALPVAPIMTSGGDWVIVLPAKGGVDFIVGLLLEGVARPLTAEEIDAAIAVLSAARAADSHG